MPADRAELALADLLPILGAGAEERELDGVVEYALYAPAGELPRADDIRALAGDAVLDVSIEPVPAGWERRWHEFLRPVRVGELVIRPPWIEGGADDLVIDPGVFFGAGTHATTRLCLALLLDSEPGGPLCDWGAGSGVLAVAAARLGWDPVTAVEVDPGALEFILANALRNDVTVKPKWLNLAATPAPWAPTVTANLTRELLLDVAQVAERPPERLLDLGDAGRGRRRGGRRLRRAGPARGAAHRGGGVGGRGARPMIRLAIRVARAQAEPVLAELLELVPGGLEERDVDEETVEYALYGAAGELPDIGELRAVAGGALVDVSTSEVPDGSDWRDWHRPLDVGPLRVRAPWAPERPGALDVVIDPGQAFGTGAHPSTRLTLALLTELPRGGPLADWGCGSGILSVAAARLGFDPVLACDHEREAVAATLAAAAANGVELTATRCDLRRAPGPWAPTVVANLVRPLLLEVAALMERPPERLIASGLELGEVDDVAAAFARHGLGLKARRDGDGWSAILLGR